MKQDKVDFLKNLEVEIDYVFVNVLPFAQLDNVFRLDCLLEVVEDVSQLPRLLRLLRELHLETLLEASSIVFKPFGALLNHITV